MLVVSRKNGERVFVVVDGRRLEVVVAGIESNKVRLGFVAPPDVKILREELWPKREDATR